MKKIAQLLLLMLVGLVIEMAVNKIMRILLFLGLPVITGASFVTFTEHALSPAIYPALFIFPIVFLIGATVAYILMFKAAKTIISKGW